MFIQICEPIGDRFSSVGFGLPTALQHIPLARVHYILGGGFLPADRLEPVVVDSVLIHCSLSCNLVLSP
jgi:hypothetical protein